MKANASWPGWSSVGMIVCMFALGLVAPQLWRINWPLGDAHPRSVENHPPGAGRGRKPLTVTAAAQVVSARSAMPAASTPPTPVPSRQAPRIELAAVDLPDLAATMEEPVAEEPVAGGNSRTASRPDLVEERLPVDQEIAPPDIATSPEIPPSPRQLRESVLMRRLPEVGETLPLRIGSVRLPLAETPRATVESAPVVSPQEVTELPSVAQVWPYPAALMESLADLAGDQATGSWVDQLGEQFDELGRVTSLASPDAQIVFDRLEQLRVESRDLARQAQSWELQSELLRASYAIARRVRIWNQVRQIAVRPAFTAITLAESAPLLQAIQEVDRRLGSIKQAQAWRNYLRLEELQAAVHGTGPQRLAEIEQLSLSVLLRIHSPVVSPRQRAFLQQPAIQQLAEQLKPWAAQPVDYVALMNHLEEYEQQERTTQARSVAATYQQLRWSADQQRLALADHLDTHYRNANVRFAISDEMINRLIPSQYVIQEKVDDVIRGARVKGRSATLNRLRIVLLPDRRRWRLGLEARGKIASETRSQVGPATFFSDGVSQYRAEKQVVVDQSGVKVSKTQVNADSRSDLTALETTFDPVPLVGLLARAIATQQHDSQIEEVESAAEEKVAVRIRHRMDRQVEKKLQEAEENFQDKYLTPLQRLRLDPMVTDLRTTGQRLIARYRLAGCRQLAAHSPRPLAPADSLLSVQVHQSALNNVLANLDLDGRRADLAELVREMGQMFQADAVVNQELPEGVTIQFAKEDAVRVTFEEDRICLSLRLVELSSGKKKWRYFIVRGYYRTDSDRLDAKLARVDHIELIGKRLSFRDQIALRGIFCKVMDKSQGIPLINEQFHSNPKMSDLGITQCVIKNGWMGLAIGPKRPTTNPVVASSQSD